MEKNDLGEKTVETLSRVLESRKAIANLLELKVERISIKPIAGKTKQEIDASVWNELGVYFLNNNMFLDAQIVYQNMLDTIFKIEKEKGITIHKGLPLHNLGVAQINMKNYDEGIPNILKAYDEDVSTFGETEANKSLANQVKEGLFSFISSVVDGNYLKWFNDNSGLGLKDTFSLMSNMTETEKLFFTKSVNSKKLMTFHNDIYTRIVMLDNLRNLALLLESNLKRRSGRNEYLPELITDLFKENWQTQFVANKELKNYNGIKGFQENLKKIEVLTTAGKPNEDFLTTSFLTIALIRNFTAHFVVDELDILKNQKEYDNIFAKEIAAILYSLNYNVLQNTKH